MFATISYPSADGPVERMITGQTDAMFFEGSGRAVVPDWKDTWALPPETELSFTGYFQQRCYGFLILSNYPAVQSVTLREVYHRWDERREATISREDLPDIRAELSALVERFDRSVDQDLWRPSPGKHCGFCPSPASCPIFPDARGAGKLSSDEEAKRAAAELCVAEALVAQRKSALKVWANRTCRPIPVADSKARRAFGYVERKSTLRPDRATLERALADGIDINSLDKLYRQRTSTVFKLHEPPDLPDPSAEDAKLAETLRASLDRLKESS